MITYRATPDVPRELVCHLSLLLSAERRRLGTRSGSRALTCFEQVVMGLRWFRDRTDRGALSRDHGVSRATAYRYIDEVIDVPADQAPDLHQALRRAIDEGLTRLILDGTVIANTAVSWPGRLRQIHAFFRARSPDQLRATAAPWTSPWLPAGYKRNFWNAA
ncbi:hypothetical protein SAMN05216275_16914 [Streptosporangium canum]|uniref:Helix-turn-helix of DDE superfamily endonuclease n=1 Tax=Streptosporangium canum TaxID=324952 RepID=A0A1I4FQ39_9ACTN|nr:hypothetical protein [Streptosporangium canum]SFL19945.1 hypothetical protein SAMN05216275_16914 [Streptosporangium canum]